MADELPPLPPLPPLPDEEPETVEHVLARAEPAPTPPAPRRERRPRRARPDEERKTWSAGHALVISAFALGLSLLLNAPGAHKHAVNQPQGWKRDLAVAITEPLATLSHALFLDRPRKVVQAIAGRSGTDEIDTNVAVPAKPTVKPVKPGTKRLAFSPKQRLRLSIAGDSLVIAPGNSIVRAAIASPAIESVGSIDGRVSTGLTRPDVYNWFDAIAVLLREQRPGALVVTFGANDDKAYMTGVPQGTELGDFGSDAWRAEYARRAGGIMDLASRAGAHLIWIGLPQTRDPAQTQRFDVVNAVVAAEARKRPRRVTFIDTYTTFASDTGGYAEYLPSASGDLQKVRADDGVHFERAGGDIIARLVIASLNRTFDLTSWRSKPS
ncbi:MAG: DUF459 domain-containing protein [Gaiellales bacterium]